jgi:hypothetical protein
MKRLIVYLVIFPLVCLVFLGALGLARASVHHLPAVAGPAFLLMLLPAGLVWIVDVFAGRAVWCVLAGFVSVPSAIDVALYSVAHPRLLESLYLGVAGAIAAIVCWTVAKRFRQAGAG